MSVSAHLSQTPAHPSARIQPVMILAGGTGGHIFPGLAVAKVLRARGVPVTWLGADGAMETRLVPQHDIPIDTLAITGLRGKGMVKLLGAPLRVMRAVRAAGFVLSKRQPRAVISFGGFAAGPGGLAARLLGAPLLVHEQNRAPGMTNKVLSRFARRVLTGFPGSFAGEEAVGNPVRAEIAALPAPADRLVGRTGPVRVLVLGGSQGARVLNQAVPTALAALGHPDVEVRHQCGEKLRAEAEAAYAQASVNASVEPFIADMAAAYAWADLVVCRAGASTLAELCAAGVGSVLVPFAAAVDDHQTRNAEYLVGADAAVLLKQDDSLAVRLQQVLQTLLTDPARRLSMANAARTLAKPDAAERIADIILQEAGTGDRQPPVVEERAGFGIGKEQQHKQDSMQKSVDGQFSGRSTAAVANLQSRSLFDSPRLAIPTPGTCAGGAA
ncbi:undecaprenyldiphospho-muramoylpentapeptide beta-N-acetylglucosaminyltransferase [Xanthomonas oryzae pv. oryzicola]|uniref:undecaprenyldiphospho-muramoylpentapeptide beta-N-acetylglucosaminyltransferase n=1 Tax=Xanthomonas oryzae TaxID=347 RepID=UPI00042167BA|nr:undecaprenyldiphospho-muramoylpentapeptide beta-N-acetylglucosaminyltransferase [Xanthomonas oryzae]AKO05745.1 UDP-diphospho-muramoylpentapeptide beta-N-acetylglucosaminyltransferase [Xanthomonas oryzae pv. oryzicola]AKO09640.1 UDP-diphospho-muramoylpentapeptide beta-N-acetylglucosaminyltransferase [Xanthomonas oryzae pv. oryzicola]OWB22669.1 undecaprenyldiphospho-muramoylpentapeptide beta-N- acetylglucosaminyltransferase [Xanthomonas oryzae pv. oryzicola]